jgi:hypothetical protein
MTRAKRTARVEGQAVSNDAVTPSVDKIAHPFHAFVEAFKAQYPDDWETIRLWPLESGIKHIAEKLKG